MTIENTNQNNDLTQINDELASTIALLGDGAKVKDCVAKINELVNQINDLTKITTNIATQPQTTRGKGVRDYGPDSQRKMDELMAWRILFGDLLGAKVKDIADDNGLSRGQVYSVREGYTFAKVGREQFDMIDVKAAAEGISRDEVIEMMDNEETK